MKTKRLSKLVCLFSSLLLTLDLGIALWSLKGESSYPSNDIVKRTEQVAYITRDNKTIYFTTIEAALKDGANHKDTSDTIYVIPGTDPTISSACTLASNDKLALILSESEKNKPNSDSKNSHFADNDPGTYRKNQVTLNAILTMEAGSELIISGNTGGGDPQGATSGDYCELVIGTSGTIKCSGTINCYGFIKDLNENLLNTERASINVLSGGKVYEPLSIYDWGSGQTAINRKKYAFPFNVYDLVNIRAKMKFSYGAKLYCYPKIYTLKLHFEPTNPPIIIGQDSEEAFIRLTDSTSFLEWNFDCPSNDKTDSSSLTHKNYVDISGDFSLGYIKTSLYGIDMDSRDFYLPISYIYSLSHSKGNGTISYKTKFLPGSMLTVKEGSVIEASDNIVFYLSNLGKDNQSIPSYPVSTPAKLINNGKLTIKGGFEGFAESKSQGGIINTGGQSITVTDCYEANTDGKQLGPYSWDGGSLMLSVSKKGDDIAETKIAQNSLYTSQMDYWILDETYMVTLNESKKSWEGTRKEQTFVLKATIKSSSSAKFEVTDVSWDLTSNNGFSISNGSIDQSQATNGVITCTVTLTIPKNKDLNPFGSEKACSLQFSAMANGTFVSAVGRYTVSHVYGA